MAQDLEIEPGSKLAEIIGGGVTWGQPSPAVPLGGAESRLSDAAEENRRAALARTAGDGCPHANSPLIIPANSSHHQSADVIGDGLKITARCPEDGIIEAIEGTSPDHFVVAVQWHPERSCEDDERSRRIFRALVEAAKAKHLELAGELRGCESVVPMAKDEV